ncbi:MAG: hypothetical protein C4545_09920 [Anaerolineaceae bacterium]|nr:MAG: hypothetical protein C4545_09920 [Anaerolineaceae bacterium]
MDLFLINNPLRTIFSGLMEIIFADGSMVIFLQIFHDCCYKQSLVELHQEKIWKNVQKKKKSSVYFA